MSVEIGSSRTLTWDDLELAKKLLDEIPGGTWQIRCQVCDKEGPFGYAGPLPFENPKRDKIICQKCVGEIAATWEMLIRKRERGEI